MRGTTITRPKVISRNIRNEGNKGTIVIDSSSQSYVFNEAIAKYSRLKERGKDPLGILCLTEKMESLYQDAAEKAISNGFITVFNETEVLKYANPHRDKRYDSGGIRLNELMTALKKVWDDQGEDHSRIYVTLGKYGCIGIEEDGTIYRASVFSFKGRDLNTNGAGDVFLSMVSRLEHERKHNGKKYSILDVMTISSGTSTYFIENQNSGKTVTENNVKDYLKGQELGYEILGNIEQALVGSVSGKLSEHPIGRSYKKMEII